MSRFNHNREVSVLGYVYRAVVVLVAAVLLVFFMPRRGNNLQSIKENEIWTGRTIYADDDFGKLKADTTLKADLAEATRDFRPYFVPEAGVGDRMVAAWTKDYNSRLAGNVPFRYRQHISEKLRRIYDTGVVKVEDYDQLKRDNRPGIIVEKGNNSAHVVDMAQVMTPKLAYEYLMMDEDTLSYRHSVLVSCDLSRYVQSCLTYNRQRSEMQLQELKDRVTRYDGVVKKGQKIVDYGDFVRGETYDLLRSLQEHEREMGLENTKMEMYKQMAGQAVYVLAVLVCLLVFFNQFRSDYLTEWRTVVMLILLAMMFPLVTYALVKHSQVPVYIIPYCILPIFLRVFLDSRTAFIMHVGSTLLCAVPLSQPFEFVLIQLVAGLVAIYGMRQLTQRSELFRAAVLVTVVSLACRVGFDLQANLSFEEFPKDLYICIAVNGCLLLISYLLLIPFERLFRFTSMVTLAELSNTNNKLLRELSEKAPGTFQHSMQVANLAGEVANKIDAKSQLVRTAAFYHDIGKLENPDFFTENQQGKNLHDSLSSPIRSSEIIRRHVKHGLKLADQFQLPKVIREFIASHHGTSLTKYFYITYKNQHPDEPVNPDDFRYPGPNPTTTEQAILMMADAVEAASHSLPEYTDESIHQLVQNIVDGQLREGYFDYCPITLQDISTAKQVFEEKLKAIYHTRISYPDPK